MGTVCKTLYGLNRPAARAVLTGCALLGLVAAGVRAQDIPVQQANDYTSVEYFDPPNAMQISSRLSGAEARPLPGNRLVAFKGFKLETFATNGAAEYIVQAPECVYNQIDGTACSAGHLTIRQADGQVTLAGDGFLWRQDDKFLTISNQVHTTINSGPDLKVTP
jgi:hypothetical protein